MISGIRDTHLGGIMFNNVYKGKKVFVTGHTGFKGSWLTAWLLSLGAEVAGYSDEVPTDPSLFEELKLSEKIKDFRGDVRDRASLADAINSFKPDMIFHLAAHAIVRECFENPVGAFTTNAIGTVNLLDIIRTSDTIKAGVFITSDKCYENVEWEYGYREDDRLGGKDPYSASKACAEIAFSAYYRSYFEGSDIKIATGRAGNVIGGGDWARDRIVPDTMKAWAKGEEVEIRSPMATRPWQHVLEPLSGYLWLGASLMDKSEEGLNGESFNFGPLSNVNKPVKDLIEEMKKTWPVAGWFCDSDVNIHKKECNLLKLSCDKALVRMDWLPNLSFDETCEFTVEWYRNFYSSKEKDTWTQTEEHIKKYETLARERKLVWANS